MTAAATIPQAAVLPDHFRDVDHLEEVMTAPSEALAADLARIPGDLIILGVGGKIGPTLARLAKRAAPGKRIVGVARFSEKGLRENLTAHGVECIAADLLDRAQIEALPKLPNVVFMAGFKFGASGHEAFTWAMNGYVPALVAEAFGGAIERDAQAIHEVDDARAPIAHFLHGRLMLEKVAAIDRVVEMLPLVVALLTREVVDAVDPALRADAVGALDGHQAHEIHVEAELSELHGGGQAGQAAADDKYALFGHGLFRCQLSVVY